MMHHSVKQSEGLLDLNKPIRRVITYHATTKMEENIVMAKSNDAGHNNVIT